MIPFCGLYGVRSRNLPRDRGILYPFLLTDRIESIGYFSYSGCR
jgi:hypothetical protein